MDSLKKYLLDNRSSLDTDIPDDANWTALSDNFSEMKKARGTKERKLLQLGMAASLLLAAAGFTLWQMKGTFNRPVPAQSAVVSSSGAVPQADAIAVMYSPVIYRELADLKRTSFYGHDRAVFKVFSLQWKALEANETAIQQNIRSVGPTDRLIHQLMDTYEGKIRLLQQFSIEIKKVRRYLPPADTLVKVPSLSLLSINTSNNEKQ